MSFERKTTGPPDADCAKTNLVYVNVADPLAGQQFLDISGFLFKVQGHTQVPDNCVGLNAIQRKILRVGPGESVPLAPFVPPKDYPNAAMLNVDLSYITPKDVPVNVNANEAIEELLKTFAGQIFTVGQEIAVSVRGSNYKLTIQSLLIDVKGQEKPVQKAFFNATANSAVVFTNDGRNPVKIQGQKGYATTQLFKTKQINFESLGIGGLDKQFEAIFRRAFASRVFPPSIVQKLGIQHVKGMLLFGPPGTGKTLIARQIGRMLNGNEPKVVNGPEILNKYVGASEENIRALFAEAEKEYKDKGDDSELHIIIFDEIDAICKSRGSQRDGTGVHDTVVNQLLTKIDGVDALNNILIIGMTNRRDMLDEALLRPGRLEVQIEIGLPDEKGRLQILKIHTSKMSTNSFLGRDVDLETLAERTKNFSGAEIEGLVKDAAAYALNRNIDFDNLHKKLDEDNIKVTMDDFLRALEEVVPAFGSQMEVLGSYCVHGIISSGEVFEHLRSTLKNLVEQVRHSDKTPMLSALLEGPSGSGKSALAATTAMQSEFPFVKVISAESMVAFSESAKSSQITKVFEDAYRSSLSVIIIDDIERLLEYVAIGPRFSNTVLQTLLVLIKKQPPPGKKLLILGTSSQGEVLESMGFPDVFNVTLHVPALREDEIIKVMRQLDIFDAKDIPKAVETLTSLCSRNVPVKKLMLWVEMAKQNVEEGQRLNIDIWQQVLRDLSN